MHEHGRRHFCFQQRSVGAQLQTASCPAETRSSWRYLECLQVVLRSVLRVVVAAEAIAPDPDEIIIIMILFFDPRGSRCARKARGPYQLAKYAEIKNFSDASAGGTNWY